MRYSLLALSILFCFACNTQDSPIDQEQKAYRAFLLEGSDLVKKKEYGKAAEVFTQAIVQQPEKAPGYLNRGITYTYLKSYEKAILDFTKAIHIDQALAIAYANRGIAYDYLSKHKEALSDYRKALSLDSEIGKGPGFMQRFLRNKPKMPDLRERADFLEETLKKTGNEKG